MEKEVDEDRINDGIDATGMASACYGLASSQVSQQSAAQFELRCHPGLRWPGRLRETQRLVAWLRERLSGWQQNQVKAAAKAKLARLEGLLERPEAAPAGGDRWRGLGHRPVRLADPTGTGQRPSCSDRRRDNGGRLGTGAGCENRANVIHPRRARRARIATGVDRQDHRAPQRTARADSPWPAATSGVGVGAGVGVCQVPVDVCGHGLVPGRRALGNALVGAGRAGAGEPHRTGGRTAVGGQAHHPHPPRHARRLRPPGRVQR